MYSYLFQKRTKTQRGMNDKREDFLMIKKNLKKSAAVAAVILAVVLSMTGCTSTTSNVKKTAAPSYLSGITGATADAEPAEYGDYYYGDAGYDIDYEENYADYALEEGVVDDTGTILDVGNTDSRKLIRTVDLEVETKEYESLMKSIQDKIVELGGYIENEYSYNGSTTQGKSATRYSNMIIRIPDNKLDEFVSVMGDISNVVSKRSTASDVTLQYTDLESKRDMYRAELESLNALLEKADTIEDIYYLTERITEVRYNIESMERQLRLYDNQVDYATINLNVSEVQVLTPQVIEEKTTKEEIKEGWAASWENIKNGFVNFGKNFVINSPYLIRALAFLAIGFAVVRITIAIIVHNVKKKRALRAAKAGIAQAVAPKTENQEVPVQSETEQGEVTTKEVPKKQEGTN